MFVRLLSGLLAITASAAVDNKLISSCANGGCNWKVATNWVIGSPASNPSYAPVVNFPITFVTSDAQGYSEGDTVTLESNLIIDSATFVIGDADRPAVDCVVSAWSTYTVCSKSCATGSQIKTRTVITQAAYGGVTAPTLSSTRLCNANPCPVNCMLSPWATWSACSLSCGGGTKTKHRSIVIQARHGGVACNAVITMEGQCNAHACPTPYPTSYPTSQPTLHGGMTDPGVKMVMALDQNHINAMCTDGHFIYSATAAGQVVKSEPGNLQRCCIYFTAAA
jgi:hypothetical protein